jgi:hypothetical protein
MLGLRHRPTRAISPAARWCYGGAAGAVVILAAVAGWYFGHSAFRESDPWARFMVALFTFGLFGLPTTFVAIVIFGLLAHVVPAMYGPAAGALAVCFLVQWAFLAWGLFQQFRGPIAPDRR